MKMKTWLIALSFFALGAAPAIYLQSLKGGGTRTKTSEGWIQVNGTSLYYQIVGEGRPIVIVHGGPGLDHTYLLPQMARPPLHYKLIFYDQRASGKSTSAVDTNSMTMGNFVEDLEGIRKAFGIRKMNLLGHSWGGLVAMFYAVKYPSHLNSLMLVNCSPGSVALRNVSFALMARHTSPSDSIAEVKLGQTEGYKKRDPETMDKFFRILFRGSFYNPRFADSLTLALDTSYATKSRLLAYLYKDRELADYNLFPKLKVVDCPTLIVGGDHDLVTPEANVLLNKSIPGSSLVVLRRCGHFPFVERPDKFFAVLESFLEKSIAKTR